jgi:hypothetical protein
VADPFAQAGQAAAGRERPAPQHRPVVADLDGDLVVAAARDRTQLPAPQQTTSSR